jgi:hypothetical protein
MRVQLRDPRTQRTLEVLEVDDAAQIPQPGRWIEVGQSSFLVLQRSHRYHLHNGRYELSTIALDVKPQARPADARPWRGGWVIGDPSCFFNALSPLLRCAVLPQGPCDRCGAYRPRDSAPPDGPGRRRTTA